MAEIVRMSPSTPWEQLATRHGGELGALVVAHDWASTPLGPVATWPPALRAAVSVCLTSRFPILVWWGPEYVMIYNDAYRPMLGASKHPTALGARGEEVWPEIWHVIGPMLDHVRTGAGATWSADQLLMLDRNGFLEECYFTFSYSPIHEIEHPEGRGADEPVPGVFTAVTETTEQVLSQRRLGTLAALPSLLGEADDEATVHAATLEVLAGNAADHPLAEIVTAESVLDDARDDGSDEEDPVRRAVRRVAAEVTRTGRPASAPTGLARSAHPERGSLSHSPVVAVHGLPIQGPGRLTPSAVLVLGEASHRPWDDALQAYAALCATHVRTALGGIHELDQERQRAEALTQLDELKTAFFTNVSHELRTPLTLIDGPVRETLLDPDLPAVQRDRLSIVERNITRLARMVDAMLDFDRLEAGRVSPANVPVAVATVLRGLADAFRPAIEGGGLTFDVDLPDLPQPAHVDPDMFERIVLNLLSNALKYTPHGSVHVALRDLGDAFSVEVRDTGIGIATADLTRIFERFERLPRRPRARAHEGAGIGLAMVKQLTELMGGQVDVRSTRGRGSTFRVTLPYGRPADGAPANPSITPRHVDAFLTETLGWDSGSAALDERYAAVPGSEPDAGFSPGGPSRPRLVVADDSADMRAFLADVLAESYRLEVVGDGEAALAAARRERPDAVLADVMMPGLDGFGLVRALRDDPELADVPIVLVSARADERATTVGLRVGADDYLVKPFSVGELRARVSSNIERARSRLRDAAWRRTVMTSLLDPMVIADEAGNIVELNHAFTELLGWSMDDAPLSLPYPWLPPNDGTSPLGAPPPDGEHPVHTRDGRRLWVERRTQVVQGDDERPTLRIVTLRDVTREHNARQRRAAATLLTAEFGSAQDLTAVLSAAVAGFAELFDGDSTVRVVEGAADHVFTAAGPVRGGDLDPFVWSQLSSGLVTPVLPTDERPGTPVPGLLLAPVNAEADCRAWVRFRRPRVVSSDERIVGDLIAQAFSLAVDRVVAASGFADRESHLAKAIESHRMIGQAIGILIERHRITPTEAFARLKQASQDRNIKLREIASRVIETGAEPDAAD